MFPQDAATWVIYILLTVLLGALGSGFWEAVFKPFFVLIGRLLLKAATLGMSSARDAIYKDMAARPTYKPAVFLVALVTFVFGLSLGYTTPQYYHVYFDDPQYMQESSYKAKIKDMSPEELKKEQQQLKVRLHEIKKVEALLLFAYSLFGSVATTLVHARYRYLSTAIAYFDQLIAICAPYLSSDEKKLLRSEFAQMTGQSDYVTIINKLRENASTHGVSRLPAFLIF